MGGALDSCRQQSSEPVDMHKNIDEWYDPFIELKKKVLTKRGVIANNMPKDV